MAARPGFSGSLGHDRVFPPRFEVVLKRYRGVDPLLAIRVNGIMSYRTEAGDVSRLKLLIASPDRHMLDRVRGLCVFGYTIRGDEGGTWTSYRQLSLNPQR